MKCSSVWCMKSKPDVFDSTGLWKQAGPRRVSSLPFSGPLSSFDQGHFPLCIGMMARLDESPMPSLRRPPFSFLVELARLCSRTFTHLCLAVDFGAFLGANPRFRNNERYSGVGWEGVSHSRRRSFVQDSRMRLGFDLFLYFEICRINFKILTQILKFLLRNKKYETF